MRASVLTRTTALAVMRDGGIHSLEGLPVQVSALSLRHARAHVDAAQLEMPDELLIDALAALRSGKHLMLRGAPGTGKTTLALALARAASDLGICGDPMLATGTADWTSVETVGAYRLRKSQELEFHPGHVLAAMRDDRWLVIDELNRADIDKAIGQLFTVLSGHPVVLPFEVDLAQGDDGSSAEDLKYVSIVPPGAIPPDETAPIRISPTWRLIATLNSQDQDLLFDMSEALQRRFAILVIPTPSPTQWTAILNKFGATGNVALDGALANLVSSPQFSQRPLGPAVVLDAARHMRRLGEMADELGSSHDNERVLESALNLFIRPHLRLPSGDQIVISSQQLLGPAANTNP